MAGNRTPSPGPGQPGDHPRGTDSGPPLAATPDPGRYGNRKRHKPGNRQNLALAAMLFAVAMTFIDQTIVAIAAPDITRELDLSSAGMRWVVNAYLLALAAAFTLAGRLADIYGHRRMVLIGTLVFVTSSALCGAVPTGEWAQTWLVTFRATQGVGAALLFPAALAIVVSVFPLEKRGRALALFFGLSGGLTAIGPLLGGWLTSWTWRAVFWVNVPVAVIAVGLTLAARVHTRHRREPVDVPGALLVALGMGLSVLGLQQASSWGWSSVTTWACIMGGLLVLVAFVLRERRAQLPLIKIRVFADRAFSIDMAVLFFAMIAFVPVFFFASVYAQVSLGSTANEAALYLLVFFGGFAVASQIGGRILDKRGAKPALLLGGLLGATGYAIWAGTLTELSLNSQWHGIAMAGAGIGLILGPASTDAVNRAIDASYGEVTGISQTLRNYASSLGMAVMGTALAHFSLSRFTETFRERGLSPAQADSAARSTADSVSGHGQQNTPTGDGREEEFIRSVMGAIRMDFAEANRVVFLIMAIALTISFVIALFHPGDRVTEATPLAPGDQPPRARMDSQQPETTASSTTINASGTPATPALSGGSTRHGASTRGHRHHLRSR